MYDLLVVGAGPAGLAFCASKAAAGKKILLVEVGKPLDQRSADPKDLGVGVAGAGAYIDGKLSFFPAGTALWKGAYGQLCQGYAELKEMLEIYSPIPEMPSEQEILDYFFSPDEHWKLKKYPSIYLDEPDRFAFLNALISRAEQNAELITGTRVIALDHKDHWVATLSDRQVEAKKVILAGGRMMPLQKLTACDRFRRHEFGVRLELPADHPAMQSLGSRNCLDPKLVIQPRSGVQFRTFCFCKQGQVCKSEINNLITYSGRADVAPTGKTNFGLMARTTDHVFSQSEIDQFLEKDFVIQAKDLCRLGPVGTLIWEALVKLFEELPQLDDPNLVIYGPCLEGVGHYPDTNNHLEVGPNLYAIGDTSGTFRGLIPSLLSGFYLAHSLYQQDHGPLLLTSNSNKAYELRATLGPLQSIHFSDSALLKSDIQQYAMAKAQLALQLGLDRPWIVEVTALEIDALNGYPGVHVGEFFQKLGSAKIYDLCAGSSATFVSVIVLWKDGFQVFQGRCRGKIVPPIGDHGFDWDCIFQPDGYDQTYGQMSSVIKTKISARFLAAKALRNHLN